MTLTRIDLLVLDEACFVSDEIWSAAKFTIIARPDSRVVPDLASRRRSLRGQDNDSLTEVDNGRIAADNSADYVLSWETAGEDNV